MAETTIADLIGKEIKCLDKGFVRLVDVMGDDSAIVQAARVSYGKGTKTVNEDTGLIRYLLRNRHTSPFEMVEMKFHVKLPIFVARQWIRHRTANVNEYSGRYSEMKDEFYLPDIKDLKLQSSNNKQGRAESEMPEAEAAGILDSMAGIQRAEFNEYTKYLEKGLAREISRINLPLSIYTEWYWKIDLHNLLHFLQLRLDKHAQYEIRVYGEAIAEMVKKIVPITWKAFEDFTLNSVAFSGTEIDALRELIGKRTIMASDMEKFSIRGGEKREFIDKLVEKLGFAVEDL